MYKYISLVIFTLVSFSHQTFGQKDITVQDIWETYTFYGKSLPGFNFQKDGRHFTRLEDNKINQYDFTTGDFSKTLFDASTIAKSNGFAGEFSAYTFNEDESKILLETESEQIYRRSSRANFYTYDFKSQKIEAVDKEAKQRYTSFNTAADKVAYVKGNDLYIKHLDSEKLIRITEDGKHNHIINGATDWVYEEEFSLAKGFAWSPDGTKIAFLRFDESKVNEFTMTLHKDNAYPEYETFKYPKVGELNSTIAVHIYDLNTGKTAKVKLEEESDIYLPRIKWVPDSKNLCVFKMNRHQNDLKLLLANAITGKSSVLLHETNKFYIDITDDLTFLKDGSGFIWTSEKDGFNHIYHHDMKGKLVKQITSGDFEVTKLYGVDENNKKLYYQSTEGSPLERHIYEVNFKGKKKKISEASGWHTAQFSSTFDYFVNTHSTVNSPSSYVVYGRNGKEIRSIEDNSNIKDLQKEYGVQPVEFFDFKNKENVSLNGYMIKPADFDASKKYPVFMYCYGGPGSQTVMDKFGGFNYWWFQMLAQQGYIVVSVDNRGTGGRGEQFKKMTYLQLGKYETIDQIEGAKYLGGLDYVDADRIGIFGWSYGGYLSSLCLLKGNDVFKSAIAVAPVTNWKWYDSIYTERYMRTDKENPDGYRNNSPVYFADQLKGNYLIVHGAADDNVHFQNTAEMVNALVMANKQFDSAFYPNRNHGIYGGPTRSHLYTKMTKFIKDNL